MFQAKTVTFIFIFLTQAAGIRETVDEKIVKKITELTLEGVRKRGEMRRHLNNFVKNELFKGETPPPQNRRRFYPRRKDLDYYISKAKLENRLAKMDQDNIEELIKKWQTTDNNFYFRKRAEVISFDQEQEFDDHSEDVEAANEEGDDEDEPEPQPQKSEQTLLFCYQSKEQKRLLVKYGNGMCLLDATYKTTRYALPLFFLCVRTNVCYQIVATFVVQYSTTASIAEALEVIKSWNPSWRPRYFMTDFADEEIHALESTFEGLF